MAVEGSSTWTPGIVDSEVPKAQAERIEPSLRLPSFGESRQLVHLLQADLQSSQKRSEAKPSLSQPSDPSLCPALCPSARHPRPRSQGCSRGQSEPGHVLPVNQEPPRPRRFHPPSGFTPGPEGPRGFSPVNHDPFPPVTPTSASLRSFSSCPLQSIGPDYACACEPGAERSAASAGPGPRGGLPGTASAPHGPSPLHAVTVKQRKSQRLEERRSGQLSKFKRGQMTTFFCFFSFFLQKVSITKSVYCI